jgi:hypothetical protein
VHPPPPRAEGRRVRHYPARKPRAADGSWGRHWLPRGEQAKFRKALLEAEGPRCWYCGATDKPLQAHHTSRHEGHMACQGCHNRETQANQLNGNPPPL